METVEMLADELEALRLMDLEGLYQEQCAERMGVSRTTLSRTLSEARRKVADALLHGKRLVIARAGVLPLSGDAIASTTESGPSTDVAGVEGQVKQVKRARMKVAITSTGTTMDSPVDPRFGRSPYIALVNLDTNQLEALANPFQDAGGGAGIQTAQFVLEKGAEALLTGHCGPRAYTVLSDAGVQVVNGISGTVREAVTRYRQKETTSGNAAEAEADIEPTSRSTGRRGGFGQGAGRSAGRGGGQGCGPSRGGQGGGSGGGRGSGGGGGPDPGV